MKNILFLDSNIFIRLIAADVPEQSEKSRLVLGDIEKGKTSGKVSVLVVNEVIWILENFYNLKREVYLAQLLKLFAIKDLMIIEAKKQLVIRVLKKMLTNSFDFTDNYLSEIATSKTIFSFDKDFEKLFGKKYITRRV